MNEVIKSFAVDLLGCGCESEVFNRISLSEDSFDRGLSGGKRILIGERLLIYLLPWEEGHPPDTALYLMRRGREERDRNGYNRFRLVLAADGPDALAEKAAAEVQSLIRGDEKLHLHLLDRNDDTVRELLG